MKKITKDELKKLVGREGLVLQGCGGDLNEWVDGIYEILSEQGILKNETTFDEIYTFQHNKCTNLLFMLNNDDLDVEKLAIWRLRTRDQFGSTWLSDYLPNTLGYTPEQATIEEQPLTEQTTGGHKQGPQKPECALIGADGNIFSLIGLASKTLRKNNLADKAKEMSGRVFKCSDYSEALSVQ